MLSSTGYETRRVLITARTYPTPARRGIEVSCTAGVTDDGRWIRLYPIPYRFLEADKRFRKYQWIEVGVKRSSDSRPESYRVDVDSIKILTEPLSSANKWAARKAEVIPLISQSLCGLRQAQREGNVSLGFLKPGEITRLEIEPEENPDWTADELAKLQRLDLFQQAPPRQLEKIPYKFYYHFTCDDPLCRGHRLSCADWEIGQSYRSWRRRYGPDWERELREKWECQMIERFDTHFFVGTLRAHPQSWIIIGLFYPLK